MDLRRLPAGGREPQRLLPARRGGLHQGTSIPAYLTGASPSSRRRSRRSSASRPRRMPSRSPPTRFPPSRRRCSTPAATSSRASASSPRSGGRSRDDDRVGAEPVIVVSHRFWMSRLGGRPDAAPRPYQHGVGPHRRRRARGVLRTAGRTVGRPLRAVREQGRISGGPGRLRASEQDWNWWVRQFGRVRPEITDEAARTQLASLLRNLVLPEGGKRLDLS